MSSKRDTFRSERLCGQVRASFHTASSSSASSSVLLLLLLLRCALLPLMMLLGETGEKGIPSQITSKHGGARARSSAHTHRLAHSSPLLLLFLTASRVTEVEGGKKGRLGVFSPQPAAHASLVRGTYTSDCLIKHMGTARELLPWLEWVLTRVTSSLTGGKKKDKARQKKKGKKATDASLTSPNRKTKQNKTKKPQLPLNSCALLLPRLETS